MSLGLIASLVGFALVGRWEGFDSIYVPLCRVSRTEKNGEETLRFGEMVTWKKASFEEQEKQESHRLLY